MKKLVWVVAIIMLITALIPVSCLAADMKKGSRGEGVREAQEWLIELGYLEGEADGIFGKKTEAAVMFSDMMMKNRWRRLTNPE